MTVPPPPDPCPKCGTPVEWNQARCPNCNTVVHLHRVAPDELDDLTPEQMERWSQEVVAHDYYGRPYAERTDLPQPEQEEEFEDDEFEDDEEYYEDEEFEEEE